MTRCFLVCVAVCITVMASAADPKPRTDIDGYPLPAEAVQRCGSLRFLVNHLRAAAFSPDGKTVYTISEADRSAETGPGLIAWNLAGLALLVNIVSVAILSMPTPFRAFTNEPANTFVTQAPYVWLPVFLVQAAWLGHLLTLKWASTARK